MADTVLSRNSRGFAGDLNFIRGHSGLFIGLIPYLAGTLYRSYTSNLYMKEDGLYTYQKKKPLMDRIWDVYLKLSTFVK